MSIRSVVKLFMLLSFMALSLVASALEKEENMSVSVVISFNVKDEKLQSFKAIMDSVKTNLPTVAGCRDVKVYNKSDDPNVFTLVETWESEESHKSHIAKVVESGDWAVISEHLVHEPTSGYFSEF